MLSRMVFMKEKCLTLCDVAIRVKWATAVNWTVRGEVAAAVSKIVFIESYLFYNRLREGLKVLRYLFSDEIFCFLV